MLPRIPQNLGCDFSNPTRYRLFISYAHDDQSVDGPYADRSFEVGTHAVPGVVGRFLHCLRNCLITMGVLEGARTFDNEVFFDTARLTAGENWADEIAQALEACDAVIALIGPGFVGSQFCLHDEVAVARKLGKTICTVVLRETGPGWLKLSIPGTSDVLGALHALPHYKQKLLAVESWSKPEKAFSELEIGLTKFLLEKVYTTTSLPASNSAAAPQSKQSPKTVPNNPPALPAPIRTSGKPLLPVPYLCDQKPSFDALEIGGAPWAERHDQALLVSLRLKHLDQPVPVLHRARLKALQSSLPIAADLVQIADWPAFAANGADATKSWARTLVAALTSGCYLQPGASVLTQLEQGLNGLVGHQQRQMVLLQLPPEAPEQPERVRHQLSGLIQLLESFEAAGRVLGRLVICVVDPEGRGDRPWVAPWCEPESRLSNVVVVEPPCLQLFGLEHAKDWHRRYVDRAPAGFPRLLEFEAWFTSLLAPKLPAPELMRPTLAQRVKRWWGSGSAQVATTLAPVGLSLGAFCEAFEDEYRNAMFDWLATAPSSRQNPRE